MEVVRFASLMLATISMGLVAGVFGLYAHTVMPGLAKTDDRTFVGAFQALDRAIINPWFIGGQFVGALVFTLVAAVAHIGETALPTIATALLLYAGTSLITVRVNVPLNEGIKAAGDPDTIPDLAAVRAEFDEQRWARWNLVRVLASTLAVALLAWSLVLSGNAA